VPEYGREGELDPGPGPRVGKLQGQELVTRHWGNLHLEWRNLQWFKFLLYIDQCWGSGSVSETQDPHVFGSPGSEFRSISRRYRSGSGSFPFLINVLRGLK
jgi:hypothetical protein